MFSCANCCGWVMPSATRNLDTKESDQKAKEKSACVRERERERERVHLALTTFDH